MWISSPVLLCVREGPDGGRTHQQSERHSKATGLAERGIQASGEKGWT